MSYDIQPFGSIFLNNNEDNEVTKHAPGAIPRMNDVKKKKRRRNAKKARRRAQAEAERREYDTWVVAMISWIMKNGCCIIKLRTILLIMLKYMYI